MPELARWQQLHSVIKNDGTTGDVKEICYEAKKHNIITVIDGCQAAPHIPIDLQDLNCDFYVF